MKYFGLIAAVCIFQSIDFSFACYGYTMLINGYQNGQKNLLKFEEGAFLKITNECDAIANVYATMERNVTSAVVSYKATANSVVFLTVKNQNLCQFLSDYRIVGVTCPVSQGRALLKIEEGLNFSKYGPILEFFAGNLTGLFKITYDGDKKNPDIFTLNASIVLKETAPALSWS